MTSLDGLSHNDIEEKTSTVKTLLKHKPAAKLAAYRACMACAQKAGAKEMSLARPTPRKFLACKLDSQMLFWC